MKSFTLNRFTLKNVVIIMLLLTQEGSVFSGWCSWSHWSRWSSCSQTCAGGYRHATRSRDCECGTDSDSCLGDMEETKDKRCGSCLNGGSVYTSNGACSCKCAEKNWGACCENGCGKVALCDEQYCDSDNAVCKRCANSTSTWKATCRSRDPYDFCSRCADIDDADDAYCITKGKCIARCNWLEHVCWPGTCTKPEYLSSTCQCSQGFTLSVDGQTSSCILAQEPSIHSCTIGSIPTKGENFNNQESGQTSKPNHCAKGISNDFYINVEPSQISYTFEFDLTLDEDPDDIRPRHHYIHDYAFGITEAKISMKLHSRGGVKTLVPSTDITSHANCNSPNFNKENPASGVISCQHNGGFQWTIDEGDKFCYNLEVKASGYMRVVDLYDSNRISAKQFYNEKTKEKEVCFITDVVPPIPCPSKIQKSKCSGVLDSESRIKNDGQFGLTLNAIDWYDPSGIDSYTLVVYDTVVYEDTISVDTSAPVVSPMTSADGRFTMSLPQQINPKLYAFYLTVYDKAGNNRKARGFMLVDFTSTVQARDDATYPLRVTSASVETDYQWQTNLKHVKVSWEERYYNDWYAHTNYLKPIASDPEIEDRYDQTIGILTVSGTRNIDGIVSFEYQFNSNRANSKSEIFRNVPYFPDQELILDDTRLKDGDDLAISIKAKDIMENSITETINVKVDSSPPAVRKIAFDGETLTIESYDNHSGMEELIWSIVDMQSDFEVSSGTAVFQSHCAAREESCVCPRIGPCMDFVITEYLGYIGPEDHQYLFTIMATNKAGLQTTRTFTCALKCTKQYEVDNPIGSDSEFWTDLNTKLVGGGTGAAVLSTICYIIFLIIKRNCCQDEEEREEQSCCFFTWSHIFCCFLGCCKNCCQSNSNNSHSGSSTTSSNPRDTEIELRTFRYKGQATKARIKLRGITDC